MRMDLFRVRGAPNSSQTIGNPNELFICLGEIPGEDFATVGIARVDNHGYLRCENLGRHK